MFYPPPPPPFIYYSLPTNQEAHFICTGILRDKTMDNKSMYIPDDVTQNYAFCRLKLLVEKFGHC